ncbi:EamA family transporter, partial [Salmonella enterica]|uniref:EamA family transporter n=1 Tax=Salmonella enterica TaxID=28901 RepID=UPI0009426595
QLSDWQLACLILCGLNTLVGYGALAAAMARWQAAQASAIITLTPLFTLLVSDLLSMAWPDFFARPMLNLLGYLGASVVDAGAMYSAIGHRIWGGLRKHETVDSQPRSGE